VPDVIRAGWVLPIAQPPIRNGWVAVERGKIIAVGGPRDEAPGGSDAQSASFSARGAWFADSAIAILPGLVNAHTHLELSWMRGQIPPARSMPAWVERLMALRRTVGSEPPEPIAHAIVEMRAAGTTLVGDVTNTFAAYDALLESDLSAAVFRELLGFNIVDARQIVANAQAAIDSLVPVAWLRISIVPHAPYSVSPQLLHAIAEAAGGRTISVHLGEPAEEVQFLRDGTGVWRALLERLGVWNPAWTPPGVGPVSYLEQFGLVNERLIAVHGVQLTDGELERLAACGATLATCPRSNAWTGAGDPPVERFYASGVRVAIGTDSLASVDDLNLFQELAALRRLAPSVPASRLLESATRAGADALGFGDELGSIEPGKRAELIAVRLPAGLEDVEEYLVSGIRPDDIVWVD
jgi:cytosine/adenosine deaminase-related metal-dependent hydrolase